MIRAMDVRSSQGLIDELLIGRDLLRRVDQWKRRLRAGGRSPAARLKLVLLGIGLLGKQSPDYMEDYWKNVVQATGAKHVVAIRWDNFALPLSQPLQPLPNLFDNLDVSMRFLEGKARQRASA